MMGRREQLKEKIREYYRCSMPYCDKTDVAPEVLEAYAEHACWLRENIEWCRALPEDIFLEHVAAYRINNERIEDCRKYFCDLVMPLIVGMSCREAVIAVNLWCSAHVTYHPADERTANALTSYRSGFGRCGEESVFTVTVLRSVGIAARQVYAPLWSHCDDNHAWVEVYCDGNWHYLGACEPEAVLDKGWFDQASSQAMLIHGRSFAGLSRGERAISKDGCVTFYPVTERYAKTAEVTFVLSLPDGTALTKALVELEILNFADYGRIARLTTDDQGRVSLPLGLGSVRLACVWNGKFYCRDAEITCPGELAVILGEPKEEQWTESFFRTPAGTAAEAETAEDAAEAETAEAAAEAETVKAAVGAETADGQACGGTDAFSEKTKQAKRMQRERLASWYRKEEAAQYPRAEEILRQAGGNFDELLAFLKRDDNPYRLKLLESLPVKDYYDARRDILEEHLRFSMPYADQKEVPEEIFTEYLLNPRLDYEELSAYREGIMDSLGARREEFAENPEKIWTQCCRGIEIVQEDAYDTLYKLPVSVLRDGKGSLKDRNNLFVAIARTCGIPSRLNPMTKEPEYYCDGRFYPADPESRADRKLKVTLRAKAGDRYEYPGNFSLARWEQDHYQVQDLSQATREEGTLEIEERPGSYRIVTVVRLEDGSQLAKEFYFTLDAQDREILLEKPQMRVNEKKAVMLPEIKIIEKGRRSSGTESRDTLQGELTLKQLQKGRRAAFLWIREGEEPTEHLLFELLERAEETAKYCSQLYVLSSREPLENGLLKKLMKASGGLNFYVIENFEEAGKAAEAMGLENSRYPLTVVADEEGKGVYGTCGYCVGSAAMLLGKL